MKSLLISVLLLLATTLLCGCDFIGNIFRYKSTTKEFAESLLIKDYDKCLQLMATDPSLADNVNIDTLKMKLENFRELIVQNFGDKLDYTFTSSEKKWSTTEGEWTAPNTTKVLIQFQNDKEFGVFEVLFDDVSGKILNIKTLDIKASIPSMTFFWLFGLCAICIPIFNIYMIIRVKRSQYKKKWLKYLAIILLNIPTITYNAISGLSFGLISIQLLLGTSFGYMGYFNSYWAFGVPIGGLYFLWQLHNGKDKPVEDSSFEGLANEQQA